MLATVLFDLTIAIFAGICISVVLFVVQIAELDITVTELDKSRLHREVNIPSGSVNVAYITGPLFFANAEKLKSSINPLKCGDVLILSMRGVPLIDTSGVQDMMKLCKKLQQSGTSIVFASVQPKVVKMMERAGLVELVGENNFFWNSEEAIYGIYNTSSIQQAL